MKTTDLPIPTPCEQSWADMVGADAWRFCASCQQHVHDLSTMTRAEADAWLATPETKGLCVRYLHDEDGTIVFRDRAPQAALVAPGRLARVKRAAMAAAALVMPMSLTACMGVRVPAEPPAPAVQTGALGEPCGAYPAPGQAVTRCADGLVCDHAGAAVDGPGVCRAPDR